jgi:hypothetical protein
LNSILFESWNIVNNDPDTDIKEKIQALDLAKSVYSMRLDLIAHTEVIASVTKFISDYKKHKEDFDQKQLISSSLAANTETEETTTTTITTNQVF